MSQIDPGQNTPGQNAPAQNTARQNDRVYIHELIDITGHNRARYQHHMTANWCPIAREERNQLCYGVWSTIGSTGAWPQVVNMWELPGWDGLVANLEHETGGGRDQDPSLAKWWAEAASMRSGGIGPHPRAGAVDITDRDPLSGRGRRSGIRPRNRQRGARAGPAANRPTTQVSDRVPLDEI